MLPPLIDQQYVKDHLGELVVIDSRWYGRSGHDAYLGGHLPGAVFVDLSEELAGAPGPESGRHPLPETGAFAAAMRRLGLDEESHSVVYDDAGGTIAARLVWMLRALGRSSALLDGGIGAWTGELDRGEVTPAEGNFAPRELPAARLVDIEEVASYHGLLLDARDASRYRGEGDPVDPRSGHIPGALSAPCRENLDETGRFLPAAQLRARFAALGIGAGTPVISYCGSGVTACHNLLALELADLGEGRLYPGSWSQWSSDKSRPIATGSETP
jgi:thiosulfate/3-mercaptopyruvate sulfurtransferase